MVTPSVKPTFTELEEDVEFKKDLHTACRGAAARANYLAADRIDCQFSCKEICRSMARPTAHSWKALTLLCRYLVGAPKLIYRSTKKDQNGAKPNGRKEHVYDGKLTSPGKNGGHERRTTRGQKEDFGLEQTLPKDQRRLG